MPSGWQTGIRRRFHEEFHKEVWTCIVTESRSDWTEYLPDRETWTPALVEVVMRGQYIRWSHDGDWIVLMSTRDDDLIRVQGGSLVQARLSVNRHTGDVLYPQAGVNIGFWEAEIYGQGGEYLERQSRRTPAQTEPAEWDQVGFPRTGKPKQNGG